MRKCRTSKLGRNRRRRRLNEQRDLVEEETIVYSRDNPRRSTRIANDDIPN